MSRTISAVTKRDGGTESGGVVLLGHLDIPTADSVRLGQVDRFAGWALLIDGTPIAQIAVMHGDEVIGTCRYGLARPDVLRAHPDRIDAGQSGFSGEVSLPSNLTGPFSVAVWDERGRRHMLPGFKPRPASFVLGPWATTLATVDRTIHPNCEMLRHAISRLDSDAAATQYYFRSAEPLIHNLLLFADAHQIDVSRTSILDFASGYGRLTRYLVKLFESVTVADTEPAMLAFNAERFGASGFLSPPNQSRSVRDHPCRYDFVFSFSLFSHLNEAAWMEWFAALFGLVGPGGFLIFSAHGHALAKLLRPAIAESGGGGATSSSGARTRHAEGWTIRPTAWLWLHPRSLNGPRRASQVPTWSGTTKGTSSTSTTTYT